MGTVGVRKLKQDTSRIIKRVREGRETFDVTYHGRVVAHIVPAEEANDSAMTLDEIFEAWDALTADDPEMPIGNYAIEAIRESRGRLE
jgi:prevent-host-death family protein